LWDSRGKFLNWVIIKELVLNYSSTENSDESAFEHIEQCLKHWRATKAAEK
jgi:hypothetical protein